MKGRLLVWPLTAALALALAGQTVRWHARLTASRLLAEVEQRTLAVMREGSAPRGLLRVNLDALRRAAALDPVEIGIPAARGAQYLVFGNPEMAVESYEEAAALEPKADVYLNLGRAELMAGHREEAQRAIDRALRLDPHLASEVPPEMR